MVLGPLRTSRACWARYTYIYVYIRVVVKIVVPFLVLSVLRHLVFRGPNKGAIILTTTHKYICVCMYIGTIKAFHVILPLR